MPHGLNAGDLLGREAQVAPQDKPKPSSPPEALPFPFSALDANDPIHARAIALFEQEAGDRGRSPDVSAARLSNMLGRLLTMDDTGGTNPLNTVPAFDIDPRLAARLTSRGNLIEAIIDMRNRLEPEEASMMRRKIRDADTGLSATEDPSATPPGLNAAKIFKTLPKFTRGDL